MTPSRTEHLDPNQLELFLDHQLATHDEDAAITHLDTCAECRVSLETMAGSHDWWQDARQSLSGEPLVHSEFEGEVAVNLVNQRIRQQLSYILGPSDDPRMLGRIGNYEVAGVVGRGGTGIVLKCFDASLDRFVAIKVLSSELSIMGAARERFKREARAAAAVTHENVIPIYAVSEFQGHSYIVMQYVPGHSLEQRIRSGGHLSVVQTLRIAMQIARALAAAHEQGLVHRDIKPGNILLEEGIDKPIVTDFGLARVANDASLTRSGAIAGTPNFMSPEQASGESVDARSDLFSLGSVMYAMCIGHPPFRAETILGVLRRVSDSEPTPLRAQNPDIPEWLEAFVFKLLAKNPDERFESAKQIAGLLSAELAHHQNPNGQAAPERAWWTQTASPSFFSRLMTTPPTTQVTLLALLVALLGLGAALGPWTGANPNQAAPTETQHSGLLDENGEEQQALTADAATREFDATLTDTLRSARQLESNWKTPTSVEFDPWVEDTKAIEELLLQILATSDSF